MSRVVDLAVSLEVAEHLSEKRAPSFIDDLCTASSCVLFGAAIPEQEGVGHLNEKWPSYWTKLFEKRGYEPYDVVRPKVWGDQGVPFVISKMSYSRFKRHMLKKLDWSTSL